MTIADEGKASPKAAEAPGGQDCLVSALREIAELGPNEEPSEKTENWGNEEDAEYHGYKTASYHAAKIARKALETL